MYCDNEEAINLFIEILKFETVSENGVSNSSYQRCGEWLVQQCINVGLTAAVLPESKHQKPIVIAEWAGSAPEMPCIFLNSHYDVVPVVEGKWTQPAFHGLRVDGKVYGRGAQDMKCVCVQYLVAISRLKNAGYIPLRTIRLSFVPDEEIGGVDGMGILLQSAWFAEKAIGIALDEGLASEGKDYAVFYGERLPWWVKVTAEGNTGHASRFIDGTAMEQILGVTSRAMEFRRKQKDLLHDGCHHSGCSHSVAAAHKTLGDVTSLNITKFHTNSDGSAEAFNVIPSVIQACFDIRISPHVEPADMAAEIDTWCREAEEAVSGVPASGGIKWEFDVNRTMQHATTSTDATVNPWWGVFTKCLSNDMGIGIIPMVFPAATDSRFLRALGIRAFGFSPMRTSPVLLHEHDEYLAEAVYLEGCEVYVKLIAALASQESVSTD